jgi:hypothetical protein
LGDPFVGTHGTASRLRRHLCAHSSRISFARVDAALEPAGLTPTHTDNSQAYQGVHGYIRHEHAKDLDNWPSKAAGTKVTVGKKQKKKKVKASFPPLQSVFDDDEVGEPMITNTPPRPSVGLLNF